jgi:hypothetical protein
MHQSLPVKHVNTYTSSDNDNHEGDGVDMEEGDEYEECEPESCQGLPKHTLHSKQ